MTTMPAAADASIHHASDSEDDLDYVPEGEERGVILYRELVVREFTRSHIQTLTPRKNATPNGLGLKVHLLHQRTRLQPRGMPPVFAHEECLDKP